MGGGTNPPQKDHLLIILPTPEPTTTLSHLRKSHPSISITYIQSHGPASSLPPDTFSQTTILAGFVLPDDPIHQAPNLRLVHWFAAGVNSILNHPLLTSTDVTVFTSSGVHGPQIAEWVIMTALVQSHGYNRLREWQKEHVWGKRAEPVRDLVGQRVGVLGYGSIGRQVGRVAKALGMDVVAYTAGPKEGEGRRDRGYVVPGTGDVEGVVPSAWFSGLDRESLHTFLRQDIDILVVSVPLTKQTTHLLGAPEFAILSKNHAFISNISRGPILVQDELIAAVKDGRLRGAALDVTDPEPLPEESPLWDVENITVTPHVSGQGSAYIDRAFEILDLNLTRGEKGEELVNVVRRERGY